MNRDGANITRVICRGVRGATVVHADTRDEIHAATRELVTTMMEANGATPDEMASVFFTTTPDLRSGFPAEAIRLMEREWEYVPMLGAVEMDKEGAMRRCIRVLLLWNTTKGQREIEHIYLRGTESLRTVDDRVNLSSTAPQRKDHRP